MANKLSDAALKEMLHEFDTQFIKDLKIAMDDKDSELLKAIEDSQKPHAAMTIPFAELPLNVYIKGPNKYKVQFDRIVTPKFTKDPLPLPLVGDGSWGQSHVHVVQEEGVIPPGDWEKAVEKLKELKAKHQKEFEQHYLGQWEKSENAMLSQADIAKCMLPPGPATPAAGKSYVLEDTQLHVKKNAHMLEFFAYETMGGSIGNVSALAKVDFDGGHDDGSFGHAVQMHLQPNGTMVMHDSWGPVNKNGNSYSLKSFNLWDGLGQKAIDPPAAFIECDGKVVRLPDLPPVVSSRRNPRVLVLG